MGPEVSGGAVAAVRGPPIGSAAPTGPRATRVSATEGRRVPATRPSFSAIVRSCADACGPVRN
ncbi:hypothetical protein CP974_05205 [Streptomyces fradiae ATCC 10745 = DSM 40063]|nr:hypothetical protein CP974_05205 [Streptomyces fradiae ATCC 10745 = DSM 40063]